MIHGEGRWTRHKHDKRKRRGWRKLHVGVSNGLIVAHYLSEDRKTDGEIAPHLIQQVGRIDSITADKTYDQSRVYEAVNDTLKDRGHINIHPRVNAESQLRIKQHLDKETYISNQSTKMVS